MRTVFVIGAGANVEIGMPDGIKLKSEIAYLLNLDKIGLSEDQKHQTIRSAIEVYSRKLNDSINHDRNAGLLNVARVVSGAMPYSISIDNFIAAHKENHDIAFCGKLAIIYAILNGERECVLYEDVDNSQYITKAYQRNECLHNSWYLSFFQKITEDCNIDDLPKRFEDISFIIFNYDRCFEYFMYNALRYYYNVSDDEARELVQHLHINHPYGIAGDLWDKNKNITFGRLPDFIELENLAYKIKTFTESENFDEETEDNNRIPYLVARANRIIFLGFAYHSQNLDLLFKRQSLMQDHILPSEETDCYGTGYHISETDLVRVRNSLMQANKKIQECVIHDITCAKFFQDLWHTLLFK